jgi:glyoxylase-like metal-dependent hydrolase (beta-lactamase superfamily II)
MTLDLSTSPTNHAMIKPFFDAATATISYVVAEPVTRQAAIIDPVLDYDFKAGCITTHAADQILTYIQAEQLHIDWILETHAHADHLTAARYLQQRVGGKVAIGAHIAEVQATFKKIYNLERQFLPDGSQFDHTWHDQDTFQIGQLTARALWVPGHTVADMAYQIGNAIFVGDTLFMPDVGTARTDFPGGDAIQLYQSIQRLLALPPETILYVCHDYPPQNDHKQPLREVRWQTTVAEQRAANIHIRDGITQAEFVAMRQARDSTLDAPTLLLPSIQINIRAGHLPPADDNGVSYLRIPLNQLMPATP